KIHDPAFTQDIKGVDAYCEMENAYNKAFPGKKTMIEDIWCADDKVFVRWKCQGTHKGTFNDIAARIKPFYITGMTVCRMQNDKIAEMWCNWDRLGVLEQIGEITEVYEMSR